MDNYKTPFWVLFVVVAVGLALAIPSFYTSRADRLERIQQLEQQRAELIADRDEVTSRVNEIETEKQQLEEERNSAQAQASERLDNVQRLQEELSVARVNSFTTGDPTDYIAKIAEFYPEMADSDWSVIQTRAENGLLRNYLKVPLGMADAFMFQEVRADNFEEQNEELESVVELKDQVIDLQTQITVLTEEKATIYQSAYDKAFDNYMAVSTDYRELLNQPNFKIDVPRVPTLLACSALGFLLGIGV